MEGVLSENMCVKKVNNLLLSKEEKYYSYALVKIDEPPTRGRKIRRVHELASPGLAPGIRKISRGYTKNVWPLLFNNEIFENSTGT